jgi:hypothetical protein
MKWFDGILQLLDSGSRLVPAENCYFGDIELLEREGRLNFPTSRSEEINRMVERVKDGIGRPNI